MGEGVGVRSEGGLSRAAARASCGSLRSRSREEEEDDAYEYDDQPDQPVSGALLSSEDDSRSDEVDEDEWEWEVCAEVLVEEVEVTKGRGGGSVGAWCAGESESSSRIVLQ